jgi:hypothetical protein
LKALAELVIALLELIEAEARALRSGALRLGVMLALLGTAALFTCVGLALLLRALYLYLLMVLIPATATLLTGIATLLVAGGLLWSARRLSR